MAAINKPLICGDKEYNWIIPTIASFWFEIKLTSTASHKSLLVLLNLGPECLSSATILFSPVSRVRRSYCMACCKYSNPLIKFLWILLYHFSVLLVFETYSPFLLALEWVQFCILNFAKNFWIYFFRFRCFWWKSKHCSNSIHKHFFHFKNIASSYILFKCCHLYT